MPSIKRAIKAGLFVGMTSQCLYGKVDPYVYSTARLIKDTGVVYLEDILPETAYVKLGWVLAHTKNVKEMMLASIAGEINKRIEKESFLY